jgi:hypothetical protein
MDFFSVNGKLIDLSGLILIFQLDDHLSIKFKCVCKQYIVSIGSLPGDRIAVSSA